MISRMANIPILVLLATVFCAISIKALPYDNLVDRSLQDADEEVRSLDDRELQQKSYREFQEEVAQTFEEENNEEGMRGSEDELAKQFQVETSRNTKDDETVEESRNAEIENDEDGVKEEVEEGAAKEFQEEIERDFQDEEYVEEARNFESGYNEEMRDLQETLAKEFQEEMARNLQDEEDVKDTRAVSEETSVLDTNQEEREETDREFESALGEAYKEIARNLRFQGNGNGEEIRSFDNNASNEEDARVVEEVIAKAFQQEMTRAPQDEENVEALNVENEDNEEEVNEEFQAEMERNLQDDEHIEDARNFDNEENEKEKRGSEDELTEASEKEMEQNFQEENAEETRNEDDEFRNEEINLSHYLQEQSNLSAQNEEERQIDLRPKARSTAPLRLSQLIIKPVIVRRCQGRANHTLANHCAKYLSCGKKMFRGAIRTCESGKTFDHITKQCRKSQLVNCALF